jgi:hypothetical protein
MADTLNVRDPNGNIVPVSVDDLTSLNGSPVTDVHIQRFKAVFGSDSVGQDVDAAHPLPVDAQSVVAVLNTILTELQAKLETGQPVDLSAGTLAALENVTATIAGTAQVNLAAPTASAPSSVAASTSSVTLAAANATRRGLSVYNDGTANLFVKHGATASASSFTVKVPAGGLYELPAPYYRGVVDGIWDVANGSARITELS